MLASNCEPPTSSSETPEWRRSPSARSRLDCSSALAPWSITCARRSANSASSHGRSSRNDCRSHAATALHGRGRGPLASRPLVGRGATELVREWTPMTTYAPATCSTKSATETRLRRSTWLNSRRVRAVRDLRARRSCSETRSRRQRTAGDSSPKTHSRCSTRSHRDDRRCCHTEGIPYPSGLDGATA